MQLSFELGSESNEISYEKTSLHPTLLKLYLDIFRHEHKTEEMIVISVP